VIRAQDPAMHTLSLSDSAFFRNSSSH